MDRWMSHDDTDALTPASPPTCAWCGDVLSARQQQRRGRYCSRRCAKRAYHATHPGLAARWGAQGGHARAARRQSRARCDAYLTIVEALVQAARRQEDR